MTLIALPGFLGEPEDWGCFDAPSLGVERFMPHSVGHAFSLGSFAEAFNRNVLSYTEPPRILMGYSMGGRLALHALLQSPAIWAAGILVSTHPGLTQEEEREKRFKADHLWAQRFLEEPWEQLMRAWENQPIFQNATHRFVRQESDRRLLAVQLVAFSLGVQEDLRPAIQKLDLPLLWIAGEKDGSYFAHAQQMAALHPTSQVQLIPNAAHRAPWEAPQEFGHIVRKSILALRK